MRFFSIVLFCRVMKLLFDNFGIGSSSLDNNSKCDFKPYPLVLKSNPDSSAFIISSLLLQFELFKAFPSLTEIPSCPSDQYTCCDINYASFPNLIHSFSAGSNHDLSERSISSWCSCTSSGILRRTSELEKLPTLRSRKR